MTRLRVSYQTPEGPKYTELMTEFDGLKTAQELAAKGFNLVREGDQLFIPAHSIIAISHVKINV